MCISCLQEANFPAYLLKMSHHRTTTRNNVRNNKQDILIFKKCLQNPLNPQNSILWPPTEWTYEDLGKLQTGTACLNKTYYCAAKNLHINLLMHFIIKLLHYTYLYEICNLKRQINSTKREYCQCSQPILHRTVLKVILMSQLECFVNVLDLTFHLAAYSDF